MAMVLKAPFHHTYQLALLSSELRDIFAAAPPIEDPNQGTGKDAGSDKRKPIEGDCPICYSELGDGKSEAIVWCRAACGQNLHQECFMAWARTKGGSVKVTCPMCRSVWEGDPGMVRKIEKSRGAMSEGYVNVADQLGISQVRGMFLDFTRCSPVLSSFVLSPFSAFHQAFVWVVRLTMSQT
jgi:hypothetical protein